MSKNMRLRPLLAEWTQSYTKSEVREKIKKFIHNPKGFFHIVSLNPEIVVEALVNEEFERAIATAQLRITDGIGVVVAARMLALPIGPRITGVDLMSELLLMASQERLRVMLIGGKAKVAERVVDCQKQAGSKAIFKALQGISSIAAPKKEEEEEIFSIVADFKPHLLFVSFGSPEQELWLDRHKSTFDGIVGMGVGGAFDFLAGEVWRAPKVLRFLGFEWLFRLFTQPWRARRQVSLIQFIWLVVKARMGK